MSDTGSGVQHSSEAALEGRPAGLRSGRAFPIHRAWLLLLALPAFVAVWGGWVGLGGLAGFGPVNLLPGLVDNFSVNLAVTLPAGMEAYAVIGLRVWLSSSAAVSDRTRRFAMRSTIGALTVGCLGQVAYHVLARPATGAPLPVTVFVACLPVAILGIGAALFHMLGDDQRAVPEQPTPIVAVAEVVPELENDVAAEQTKRERVAALFAEQPELTVEQVAELVPCSPRYVRKLREKEAAS